MPAVAKIRVTSSTPKSNPFAGLVVAAAVLPQEEKAIDYTKIAKEIVKEVSKPLREAILSSVAQLAKGNTSPQYVEFDLLESTANKMVITQKRSAPLDPEILLKQVEKELKRNLSARGFTAICRDRNGPEFSDFGLFAFVGLTKGFDTEAAWNKLVNQPATTF